MRYLTMLCITASFLAGCTTTPATQIQAFGDSTKAITDKVDAVIGEYNQSALARIHTDLAATYNKQFANGLTSKTLEDVAQPIDDKTKRGFAMYRANRALGEYAKSLSALASAGSRADIDLATAKLYGAMSGINTQYRNMKSDNADLFNLDDFAGVAKVVAAIGSTIVEEKRNEAIKRIVTSADAKISLLCDTINKQLEDSGIHDGISASRQYVLSEEIRQYKGQVQKDTTLDWRRNEIKRLYELKKGVSESRLLVQNAQKAILAVKSAHGTLASELKKDKYSSEAIAMAIGRLRDLEKHYDNYETLLLECKKIEKDDKGILSCGDKP